MIKHREHRGVFLFLTRMHKRRLMGSLIALSAALLLPFVAFASGGEVQGESAGAAGHVSYALVFGAMAMLLMAGKIGGLIERVGQPAVLGEIVVGLVLGNLTLFGIGFFRELAGNEFLVFLAELGVVILLFQIGLESDLRDLRRVGVTAFLVAMIGMVVPMALGWKVVGPWLLPGQSEIAYLFVGAAMTATSVGITARVFQDLGKLSTRAAQVVLGAAVIDDVGGLLILAVVSGMATTGAIAPLAIAIISLKALGFLVGAIVLGRLLANHIGAFLSRIHTGIGMKLGFALTLALGFAALAQVVGLAPIVGAFAAGLILDSVVFSKFKKPALVEELQGFLHRVTDADARTWLSERIERYERHHVDDLVQPIGQFLVPIFFVLTGMRVDLTVLADPSVVFIAIGVSVAAVIGKIAAGVAASKGDRLIVGIGMIPRGEVGLIFANIGKSLGVISDQLFAVIVVMVVVTTLVTPPLLAWLIRREGSRAVAAVAPSPVET